MSSTTNIAWTEVTDNIIVAKDGGWWCRMISPGCANCYAAKLNQNTFFGGNKLSYSGSPPELILKEDIINGWEHQRIPKKHFICSMTDVFGDWVTEAMATTFLRGMRRAPKQTFQLLTKRPDIALARISAWLKFDMLSSLPPNIWIGVSVENQEMADKRIPQLLSIPATVRFLSLEPLLGPVDLTSITDANHFPGCADFDVLNGRMIHHDDDMKWTESGKVDWIIIGGESGPGARACNVDWIRSLVQQGNTAGVATFVKQLGAKPYQSPEHDGGTGYELPIKDKKGGDPAEWPADLRVQQWPQHDAGLNNLDQTSRL